MSEALDYLLKVRKDAIEPYFQFLKEGGKHLDDKTRSLLSVITKVDAKTEAGLKQYLKRALKHGNTADEILDAMLTCIPTLGLSKIIWAIDIIIKMDLPEFDSDSLIEAKQKKKQWQKIKVINEIDQGASYIEFNNQACFVVRKEDGFQVFDDTCPHKAAKIPCDAIDDMTLQCPMHQWRFNLENGECLEKGNQQPLNKIEYKVEESFLYVYL
ncbi:MAG: Rieske 2Fe-2S domain-containing protein [Proteobacteria bacterium]|nr:carboxymuconolactone decarboxylase [Pseudomonadota bacterium]NOG60901.1 Rieske 2Fe-2S domain-containing protein [Pseudomonadota bacterium]